MPDTAPPRKPDAGSPREPDAGSPREPDAGLPREPNAGPPRELDAGLRSELVEAAQALSRLGLVTAYGHVSVRAGTIMVITPAADLATVTDATLVDVPLAASSL